MLMVMAATMIVACGGDDNDSNSQVPDRRASLVVGKWELTEYWNVWQGLGYFYESHWEKVQGDLVFSINSNGTCSTSGTSYENVTLIYDITEEMEVWFPVIDRWEWSSSNTSYPLKLYFPTSGNSSNFAVTFQTDNNLEIMSGDMGYRFKRTN